MADAPQYKYVGKVSFQLSLKTTPCPHHRRAVVAGEGQDIVQWNVSVVQLSLYSAVKSFRAAVFDLEYGQESQTLP